MGTIVKFVRVDADGREVVLSRFGSTSGRLTIPVNATDDDRIAGPFRIDVEPTHPA